MSPVRRFTDGAVTIELTGQLEAWVERAVNAASNGAVRVIETACEQVASEARNEWYQHVTQRTGLSGDIQVVTTINADKGIVKVSVGSTDKRIRKAKYIKNRGKPEAPEYGSRDVMVASFVHEPGPFRLVHDRWVSHAAYWASPEHVRGPTPKKGHPAQLMKPIEQYGESRKLLPLLVKNPVRRRIAKIGPEIIAAIKQQIEATHG